MPCHHLLHRQDVPRRADRDWPWLIFATEVDPPLRQTVVPLQRRQIRSPAQALSNIARQLRQRR
jgi:hypothetical protein